MQLVPVLAAAAARFEATQPTASPRRGQLDASMKALKMCGFLHTCAHAFSVHLPCESGMHPIHLASNPCTNFTPVLSPGTNGTLPQRREAIPVALPRLEALARRPHMDALETTLPLSLAMCALTLQAVGAVPGRAGGR